MATRDARSSCKALCRRNGIPVMLVIAAIAFLGFATRAGSPLPEHAEAQVEPTPSPAAIAQVTSAPSATPRVIPTRTPDSDPREKQTPTPVLNVVVTPTMTSQLVRTSAAPAAVVSEKTWSADAWKGGYFQGNAVYYGRPWTALYGGQSDYPRATLLLTLTDDPTLPVELFVTGLDDELAAKNTIEFEVNGQRVYQGESWFPNWNGIGIGASADWATVRITIPPDLMMKGNNRITIRNVTAAANFGSPPYLLLASAEAESEETGIFGKAPLPEIVVAVVDQQGSVLRSLAGSDDQ